MQCKPQKKEEIVTWGEELGLGVCFQGGFGKDRAVVVVPQIRHSGQQSQLGSSLCLAIIGSLGRKLVEAP